MKGGYITMRNQTQTKQTDKVPARRILWTNNAIGAPAGQIAARYHGFKTAEEAGLSVGDIEESFEKYIDALQNDLVLPKVRSIPNQVIVMHTWKPSIDKTFERQMSVEFYSNLTEAFARIGIFNKLLHKWHKVKLFDENGHLKATVQNSLYKKSTTSVDVYEFKLVVGDDSTWVDKGISLQQAFDNSHYTVMPRLGEKILKVSKYAFAETNNADIYKY